MLIETAHLESVMFSAKEITEFILIPLGVVLVFSITAFLFINSIPDRRRKKKIRVIQKEKVYEKRTGTLLAIINSTASGSLEDCEQKIKDYLFPEFSEKTEIIRFEFQDRGSIKDIFLTLPNADYYHFRLEPGHERYNFKK